MLTLKNSKIVQIIKLFVFDSFKKKHIITLTIKSRTGFTGKDIDISFFV